MSIADSIAEFFGRPRANAPAKRVPIRGSRAVKATQPVKIVDLHFGRSVTPDGQQRPIVGGGGHYMRASGIFGGFTGEAAGTFPGQPTIPGGARNVIERAMPYLQPIPDWNGITRPGSGDPKQAVFRSHFIKGRPREASFMSPFDLDAAERVTRFGPFPSRERPFPFPVVIGAVQGLFPLLDDYVAQYFGYAKQGYGPLQNPVGSMPRAADLTYPTWQKRVA